jgi:hypothetical protein
MLGFRAIGARDRAQDGRRTGKLVTDAPPEKGRSLSEPAATMSTPGVPAMEASMCYAIAAIPNSCCTVAHPVPVAVADPTAVAVACPIPIVSVAIAAITHIRRAVAVANSRRIAVAVRCWRVAAITITVTAPIAVSVTIRAPIAAVIGRGNGGTYQGAGSKS